MDVKEFAKLYEPVCRSADEVDENLYEKYGVKRGLRDKNGKGVLTGVTNISKIVSSRMEGDKEVQCDGQLWYRGYNVIDMVQDFGFKRFGFEEVSYLLLFGELPTDEELANFKTVLGSLRTLPTNFTRDVIMKAPSHDIMNSMTKSVLTLSAYDDNVSDLSIENVLEQCLRLISEFPMLAVYGYCAYNHYERDESMHIHFPDRKISTAENILRLLRPNKEYTLLEAQVLDAALVLHAEHGGGNNSTFTTRVVSSAGSDTYSVMAAALSSLKGPKHGGANLKVMQMMASYELLDEQVHKNVAIIPIKTPINHKIDLLTLKKGFELGLVNVKECEQSTVNTIIVENKSVAPLLLVDGEEIVGGDQDRIMDATILIAPQSEKKIPVNCTEHGRWRYESDFKQSEHIANYRTRLAKHHAFRNNANVQQAVWDSIDDLEMSRSFSSPTQAMSESYENAKADLNEFLDVFDIVEGQTGIVVLVDGEIKGFEVFLNTEIYREYHEKILKSYLINAEVNDNVFTINKDTIESVIEDALSDEFEEVKNEGLETRFEIKSEDGVGSAYTYKDELIHMSYLVGNAESNLKGEKVLFDDVRI